MNRGRLDIRRHIDQNRSSSAAFRDIKRFPEHTRDIVCVTHQIGILDKRFHGSRDIRLLEHVGTDHRAVDLPGDADKRD